MKKMILIVDDEERVLFVLQNALTKLEHDFEVVTAATGEEGLQKARHMAFDLVVTDMIMPDMDGIEFTEEVRNLPSKPAVVWMTAYGCPSFEGEAERLGVYRCVEKPLEIHEFRDLVRAAMSTDERNGRGPHESEPGSAGG